MRALLLLFATLLATACRPADGGSQNAPRRDTPQTAAAQDSARISNMLERADAARIQGQTTAPIWLIEVSDFQCPYCKRWHDETYPTIVREYVVPGHVRLAYVNLPLSMHTHAEPAAEAALCAGLQGKFWQMHDKLFATQERWAPLADASATFDSLALATGVNAGDWRGCMSSKLMQRVINGDRTRAVAGMVRSTPTFFVGSERIEGAQPMAVFRAAIERARAQASASGRPRP